MTDYADLEAKLRKARRDLVDALEENEQLENEIKTMQNKLDRYERGYTIAPPKT